MGQLDELWKDYRYKQIEHKRGITPKQKGPYRYLDLVRDGIGPEPEEFVALAPRELPPSTSPCSDVLPGIRDPNEFAFDYYVAIPENAMTDVETDGPHVELMPFDELLTEEDEYSDSHDSEDYDHREIDYPEVNSYPNHAGRRLDRGQF